MLHWVYFGLSYTLSCLRPVLLISLGQIRPKRQTEQVISKIAPSKIKNKQKIIIF